MPKLSFIITAFNRPALLHTCLASLVAQTFSDWDAIIVDNSDSSWCSQANYDLRELDSDRIAYVYTGGETAIEGTIHKRSLYKATELGVLGAKGDFLCFPNCDSYYTPVFAARMLKAAEEHDWGLVYCDLVLGSPDGGYGVLGASPSLCNIDKTNFIVRREHFIPFDTRPENYPQADGMFVEELVRRGIKHGRVPEVLVVHN